LFSEEDEEFSQPHPKANGHALRFKKTAGKWLKCNLVSGMASVANDMGWL